MTPNTGANPIWITNLIPFKGASVTQKDAAVTEACGMITAACHKAEKRPPLKSAA